MSGLWHLEGFDTFAEESYPLEGEYPDQQAAEAAARKRLQELERDQPTETSGGQSEHGIQDRVYVVRPDGTRYRFVG
jgi:hypothetical protein